MLLLGTSVFGCYACILVVINVQDKLHEKVLVERNDFAVKLFRTEQTIESLAVLETIRGLKPFG